MNNFSYFTVLNIVPLVKFSEQGIETKSCICHLFCVPGKKICELKDQSSVGL